MLCNYHNVCAVTCRRTRFSPTDYTQHSLHQNIFIKHKISSSGCPMSAPTVSFVLSISKLSTRIGNGGSPYRIVQIITMLPSGILCPFNIKLSTRMGNGGSPARCATASCLWKNALCITI